VATRAFALPRDPARFADLVKAGTTRPIDAGIATNAEGKRMAFLLWLGAGLDATLIETVAARRHGKSGAGVMLEYVRVGMEMTLGYQWPEIDVASPSASGRFGAAMIANIGPLAVGSITRHANPGDGLFDLIATRPRSRLAWVWAAMLGGFGLFDRVSDVERVRITEATLASAQRVPIQLDGEPCGTLPVSVRIRPSAIRLLSPAERTA
jgi:diacylglycerol kinase family enzyme